MSGEPQALYQEDDKECSRNLLRSVNLKPQAAGVHLEISNLSRGWTAHGQLKETTISADRRSGRFVRLCCVASQSDVRSWSMTRCSYVIPFADCSRNMASKWNRQTMGWMPCACFPASVRA